MNYTVFTCNSNGDGKLLKIFPPSETSSLTILVEDVEEKEMVLIEMSNNDIKTMIDVLQLHLKK